MSIIVVVKTLYSLLRRDGATSHDIQRYFIERQFASISLSSGEKVRLGDECEIRVRVAY